MGLANTKATIEIDAFIRVLIHDLLLTEESTGLDLFGGTKVTKTRDGFGLRRKIWIWPVTVKCRVGKLRWRNQVAHDFWS